MAVLVIALMTFGIFPAQADGENLNFEEGTFEGWTTVLDSNTWCDSHSCGFWLIEEDISSESPTAIFANLIGEGGGGPAWGILAREFDNTNNKGSDLTLDLAWMSGWFEDFLEPWRIIPENPLLIGCMIDSPILDCEGDLHANQWIKLEILSPNTSLSSHGSEDVYMTVFAATSNEVPNWSFEGEEGGWYNYTISKADLPNGKFLLRLTAVGGMNYLAVGMRNISYEFDGSDPLFAQDAHFNSMVSSCRRDFAREVQALRSPSLSRYESCMFMDVNNNNISRVNADLAASFKTSVAAGKSMSEGEIIIETQKMALRYNVIERLVNKPETVYINDLINIGLTGLNNVSSRYQAINTLRGLPNDQIDTYAELEAEVRKLALTSSK